MCSSATRSGLSGCASYEHVSVDLEGGGRLRILIGVYQGPLDTPPSVSGSVSCLSRLVSTVNSVVVRRRDTGEQTGFIWRNSNPIDLGDVLPDHGLTPQTTAEEIERVLREKYTFTPE